MSKTLLSQVVKGRIEAGCDEAGRGCLQGRSSQLRLSSIPQWRNNFP